MSAVRAHIESGNSLWRDCTDTLSRMITDAQSLKAAGAGEAVEGQVRGSKVIRTSEFKGNRGAL